MMLLPLLFFQLVHTTTRRTITLRPGYCSSPITQLPNLITKKLATSVMCTDTDEGRRKSSIVALAWEVDYWMQRFSAVNEAKSLPLCERQAVKTISFIGYCNLQLVCTCLGPVIQIQIDHAVQTATFNQQVLDRT